MVLNKVAVYSTVTIRGLHLCNLEQVLLNPHCFSRNIQQDLWIVQMAVDKSAWKKYPISKLRKWIEGHLQYIVLLISEQNALIQHFQVTDLYMFTQEK